MPPSAAGHDKKKSPLGANISGGFRVYKSMQDEAMALVMGPAGAGRGTETTEVTMLAGSTSRVMKRSGAGCRAGQPAHTLCGYPMRL
ncbi:MAG: hypothetical protein WKF75_19275 [Singulisphaera sp.]